MQLQGLWRHQSERNPHQGEGKSLLADAASTGSLVSSTKETPLENLQRSQDSSTSIHQQAPSKAHCRSRPSSSYLIQSASVAGDHSLPVDSESTSTAVSTHAAEAENESPEGGLVSRPSWPRNASGTYLPTTQPLTSEPSSSQADRPKKEN